MTVHVGLYGDVNLNIVDGSAIWLVSVAQLLDGIEGVRTTVLLKAPVERDVLSRALDELPTVTAVEPQRILRDPVDAAARLESIDVTDRFDAIVLRGLRLCAAAANSPVLQGRLWVYLTDFPQQWDQLDLATRNTLAAIDDAAAILLCQTPRLRDYLEAVLRDGSAGTALLPPLVPPQFYERADSERGPADGPVRLLYAGKFAPGWGFLETVAALGDLVADGIDVELHVAGDKVHKPAHDPAFAPAVEAALESTPRLVWHGAVARDELPALVRTMDAALSPRSSWLDDSLELSTKILEYGASGLPVVLNRNAMQTELLGDDYPLYLDRLEDLPDVLRLAVTDRSIRETAAEATRRAAAGFSIEAASSRLAPHVHRLQHHSRQGRATRLVVAGHDLKFLNRFLPWFERHGCEIRIDQWGGHNKHDERHSRSLAKWADVILCEWSLGNAVWYSRHKHRDQRLVIRLHQQELSTPHPGALEVDSIDKVITVSPWMDERINNEASFLRELVEVIPNAVDTLALDRPKLPGAQWTLGMLGFLPWLKRPDLAIDFLEHLLDRDDRYRLVIAGPLPWELDWLWARNEERTHFEGLFERVRQSAMLASRVSFDGRVSNVAAWLQKVGVVLSPSDSESFHLAMAEGMASRAVPVIVDRPGAALIFGDRWVHGPMSAATDDVLGLRDAGCFAELGEEARVQSVAEFALDSIAPKLVSAVLGEPAPSHG